MQQPLINLSPDLKKLFDDGYLFEVSVGGHLVVHHIPYVSASRQVKFGTFICPLTLVSKTQTGPPPDHTLHFSGETPCDQTGRPMTEIINSTGTFNITREISAQHLFSSRPITGRYANYYDKIRTYAEILSSQAKAIDSSVTACPNKPKTTNHE